MDFLTNEYKFPSVSGLCDIVAHSAAPVDFSSIKGVVQISHGMAEYSNRYSKFIIALCNAGYAVFINDHVGHGLSVSSKEMLGFFGEEKGEETFIDDLKTLTDMAKSEYPGLPIFMLGHGMGSLVARKYTAKYGYLLDGVIYTGTSGENPALGVGILLANTLIKQNGPKHRSDILDTIAFGTYNRKTEKRTDRDWSTRDKEEVDKILTDELCGYTYTVSGMKVLFTTLKQVTSKRWYNTIPPSMPILLASGDGDPVGDYSKGVKEVYRMLKKTGHKNVTMKIYEGARHEILNEINRDEVYADIIAWLDEKTKKQQEENQKPLVVESIDDIQPLENFEE